MKISACLLLVVSLALMLPQPSAACKCSGADTNQVCGSDGVSYQNACALNCKNLLLRDQGQPEITIVCSKRCEECP